MIYYPLSTLIFSCIKNLFRWAIKQSNSPTAVDISVVFALIVTGKEHCFIALDHLLELPMMEVEINHE